MDEVLKLYATSDGDPFGKPSDRDSGQVEAFVDEEDEFETAGILTSSDDDEVIAEETVIAIVSTPAAPPKPPLAQAKLKTSLTGRNVRLPSSSEFRIRGASRP